MDIDFEDVISDMKVNTGCERTIIVICFCVDISLIFEWKIMLLHIMLDVS